MNQRIVRGIAAHREQRREHCLYRGEMLHKESKEWKMKKLLVIIGAAAMAAGVAYVVIKAVEELNFEDEEEDLTPEDVESQLLQHE